MATKDKGKTPPAPEPEPKEPVPEPSGAPDPTPEPVPEPSDIPERFQGKKPEEIIKMYEEAEKEKDRLGTEVGNLRKETDEYRNNLAYYQNLAQDLQAQREKGGQPESSATPDVRFDYDNPVPSVQQVVQTELQKYEEKRKKMAEEREYKEATVNYAGGRNAALKSNPDLFRGIERQVEQGVWQAYQGKWVGAHDLKDPKTWENAARLIHMNNEDYDRLVPPKVNPVPPTPTERPGATKTEPPEEEAPHLELDDFGKELLTHRPEGMSEEDFLKLVQETRRREGR
jgi:hypothetical protein